MEMISENEIARLLEQAVKLRQSFIDTEHQAAFRLFNGFYEGIANLVVDIYGSTMVLFSNCENETDSISLTQSARDILIEVLPWIKCAVVKHRHADDPNLRRGEITYGSQPDDQILEHNIQYAVDLTLNQDTSFYLDTRYLRHWLLEHSAGLEVLNTFAYTGSLGVASLAGGAHQVVQVDRNQRFLDLARHSAMLNHLDLGKMKLRAVDFFVGMGQFKRSNTLFDLAIIDPPFFSITDKGLVDQATQSTRLINKVRPLVKDGGRIVAINNALFLEGSAYMRSLEELSKDGFVEIEEIIPVPSDITGFRETIVNPPPVDPEPFNHPTKIAVLKVKRKS